MLNNENIKITCFSCGYKTLKAYNFNKRKWVRKVFKCPKCRSNSFSWSQL